MSEQIDPTKKSNQTENDHFIEIEAKLYEQEHRPVRLVWNFFNRNKWYNKKDPRNNAISRALIWRLFFSPTTIAIASGGIISVITVIFLARQTNEIKTQTNLIEKQNLIIDNQNQMISQQTSLQEASRRSSQLILLDGIFKDMNLDLNSNKNKISDGLTARIISFSQTAQPYKIFDYDKNGISDLVSPERSQLLYTLVSSNLGKEYLDFLYKKANFEYCDLSGYWYNKKRLKNINLRYSIFSDTKMQNADLEGADLRNTSIKLSGFYNVNFKYADLRDAIIDSTRIKGANFSKSDLRKTIFKNLDISEIDSIDGAKVNRLDWFDYLSDKAFNLKGVEALKNKYTISELEYKNMGQMIPTIVRK